MIVVVKLGAAEAMILSYTAVSVVVAVVAVALLVVALLVVVMFVVAVASSGRGSGKDSDEAVVRQC